MQINRNIKKLSIFKNIIGKLPRSATNLVEFHKIFCFEKIMVGLEEYCINRQYSSNFNKIYARFIHFNSILLKQNKPFLFFNSGRK